MRECGNSELHIVIENAVPFVGAAFFYGGICFYLKVDTIFVKIRKIMFILKPYIFKNLKNFCEFY